MKSACPRRFSCRVQFAGGNDANGGVCRRTSLLNFPYCFGLVKMKKKRFGWLRNNLYHTGRTASGETPAVERRAKL